MVSLPEKLQMREAAARQRAEELRAEATELADRLEKAREDLSWLEVTRDTVAQALVELSAAKAEPHVPTEDAPESEEAPAPHGGGVMMVSPRREGLVTQVLPDAYWDIVEIIADAPGPLQTKRIVPRIGLPTTGEIEGARGKLKRLVERGWPGGSTGTVQSRPS
jgi:vacuolar-type H+-ATPase subunit I/STV1